MNVSPDNMTSAPEREEAAPSAISSAGAAATVDSFTTTASSDDKTSALEKEEATPSAISLAGATTIDSPTATLITPIGGDIGIHGS